MRLLFKQSRSLYQLKEMQFLLLALIIGVSCLSAMLLFTSAVKQKISTEAASVLGAERVLKSSVAIKPAWQKRARDLKLNQSMSLRFFSMTEFDERLQLAEVVAIKGNFPLRGEIILTDSAGKKRLVKGTPALGHIWVSPRLLPLLGVKLGDKIFIGEATFVISDLVEQLPGANADWLNISPTVVMNWQSVASTQVVKAGSRLSYQWLLSGEQQDLNTLNNSLSLSRQQQWLSGEKSLPVINRLVVKALDYFRLGSLVCLLLTAIVIAKASLRLVKTQQRQVAMLRCFGVSFINILYHYLAPLVLLSGLACIVGAMLGYLMQGLLSYWFSELLSIFVFSLSLLPAVQSIIIGMSLMLCFSFAYLLGLKEVSAVRILQQSGSRLRFYHRGFLVLGFIVFFLLCYWVVPSLLLLLGLGLGLFLFVCLIVLVMFFLFKVMEKNKRKMPLWLRFGVTNITRDMASSSLQVAAVGLSVWVILSLQLLSSELLNQWKAQLPTDAANYFVMNIERNQLTDIKAFFSRQAISRAQFYGVTRGRLSHINGIAVKDALGPRFKDVRALQRELNLSASMKLPNNNRIVKGNWAKSVSDGVWVSVEQGVASRIGLHLGDRLQFQLSDSVLVATISSIRSVEWTSFTPNFFFLFKPGTLSQLPQTFLTSFYVPPSKQQQLAMLVKQFRNVTLIDMAGIMNQMQGLLSLVSYGMQWVSGFCLVLGLLIVLLAMRSYAQLSRQLKWLMRVFGLSQGRRRQVMLSESVLLGFIAGLLAVISAVALNYYLAQFIFNIELQLSWWLVSLPVFLALFMGLLS